MMLFKYAFHLNKYAVVMPKNGKISKKLSKCEPFLQLHFFFFSTNMLLFLPKSKKFMTNCKNMNFLCG